MVEIRVLRTGKALHSLFSSGSVFMVVFFSFLGYYFFFLWLHSSKTEYSLPQVYWTKSIATKENDSHFCFHNTSQPYSFLLGSPWVCRRWGGGCVPSQLKGEVGLALGLTPGTFSVTKVIRLPFWLRYPHHDGKNTIEPRDFPCPQADIQHSGRGSHNLHLGIRRQTKESQQATWRPSSCSPF